MAAAPSPTFQYLHPGPALAWALIRTDTHRSRRPPRLSGAILCVSASLCRAGGPLLSLGTPSPWPPSAAAACRLSLSNLRSDGTTTTDSSSPPRHEAIGHPTSSQHFLHPSPVPTWSLRHCRVPRPAPARRARLASLRCLPAEPYIDCRKEATGGVGPQPITVSNRRDMSVVG